ncbi:unnamed protein product [Phytophthora fragariaefolia]|uniref:Unnamed protein product n=1 Tax=Phytophthora fragariaefolia TaxID=1490495 RepID=A0A9W6XED7_9STRA|nr:unnamed protein product [Phytophthora fragariaefolia]
MGAMETSGSETIFRSSNRNGFGSTYVESRSADQQSLQTLLDQGKPSDEKTTPPLHFYSEAIRGETSLPQFVKDWLLEDIKCVGTHRGAFQEEGHRWSDFRYDEARQETVDRMVNKGVAPGHGGVSQEL